MVGPRQVRSLMEFLGKGKPLYVAATRSGMTEKGSSSFRVAKGRLEGRCRPPA